jgi:hypothetical protein
MTVMNIEELLDQMLAERNAHPDHTHGMEDCEDLLDDQDNCTCPCPHCEVEPDGQVESTDGR